MKNQSIILLCGFRRGGTNIVWNLLQSHPQVCSPIYETGELIQKESLDPNKDEFASQIDEVIYQYKLKNFNHPENGEKAEGISYGYDEIASSLVCLKSVDEDIFLLDSLLNIYPSMPVIFLVRNGYAICEGWMRRGVKPEVAGEKFQRISEFMIRKSMEYPNTMTIKFEDVLRDPFKAATSLFEFVKLNPKTVGKLRLKVKKSLSDKRDHTVRYGKENKKYWLDSGEVKEFLNQDIDQVQINSLNKNDKLTFEKASGKSLEFFGYI